MILQIGMLLQKKIQHIFCATKKIDGNAFQIDPPSPLSKETDTVLLLHSIFHSLWPISLETDELL